MHVATEAITEMNPETQAGAAGEKVNRRRQMVGVVTSDKMNKTRVVQVERRVSHGKYGKYVTRRTKFKVHDERNEAHTGDRVLIVESRPLSRDKRWRLKKLIERATEV
jgi:small subunit ribosomal protein S17